MKAATIACALVVLGGLSPAVASAEPDVPSGGYDIRYSDGQSIAWQFTPCGPDCTVASSPGSSLVSNWRFQLTAGTWTYSGPHQIPCRDGSGGLPVVLTYTFDAATLAGDSTATTTADGCGKPAGASNVQQFQLVKTD
jgi:hypothetical protein